MELHAALEDYKRSKETPHQFPGERRTTAGRFSGFGDRLVHVAPDGSLRDHSYPLSGLGGIERSRFGLEDGGQRDWFEAGSQSYVDDTAVVETRHETDWGPLRRLDLTVDRTHLTHVVLPEFDAAGSTGSTPTLLACLGFAPGGQAGRVGQLVYENAVEFHHDRERDFVTASTPFERTGQTADRFEQLLSTAPTEYPQTGDAGRYEEAQLSGTVVLQVPLQGTPPRATIVTRLATADEAPREELLPELRATADTYHDTAALLERGRAQMRRHLPTDEDSETIADLRVLALLRSSSGARIAGPEFDPFYQYTGGYGYTWFRDDAEIARYLLLADTALGLGLDDWHDDSAALYADTQLPDGTWPHRVWPHSQRIAPGWAHGRLEGTDTQEYQADQTASVAAFLATYLREGTPGDEARLRTTLSRALDGLDTSLDDDGLPERAQNAWENMHGQFAHTTATFLDAYAAIARAPMDEATTRRARAQADAVYNAIDQFWLSDTGTYALGRVDGELDDRLDGSTLALATAHRQYAAVGTVDDQRLDKLVSHVEATLSGLSRRPTASVEGLIRFEGDEWRTRDQEQPKVWTVTTAWGAHAALELAELLADAGRDAAATRFEEQARKLHGLCASDGLLRSDGAYLPEQFFDDGTPDSATPLGWPHAISLATAAQFEDHN